MYVIADVCIIPLDVGLSLSPYVAEFEKIFDEVGLKPHLHGYGTNIEGSWDEVMRAIRLCHEKAHALGAV
ncbi:MTH1187 family thiamine-binding protein, partial [bacterium]|nr:MTH1187 family thiamine-binding protein [bacterium]